jgi:hypothetical protein
LTWSVPTVTEASPARGPATPSTPRSPTPFRNDVSVVQERVGGHPYSEEEYPLLEDTTSTVSAATPCVNWGGGKITGTG